MLWLRARNGSDRPKTRLVCMLPSLHSRLGFHGEGPDSENVLNSPFLAPNQDKFTQEFLHALSRPDHVVEQEAVITKDEWVCLWNRSAERTACGD